jgi:hypothetical protein
MPYENHVNIAREVDAELDKWSNTELFNFVVKSTWESEADKYETNPDNEDDDAFRFYYRIGHAPEVLWDRLVKIGFINES